MHVVADRQVMTLEAALERVSTLIGTRVDWTAIERFLPPATGPAAQIRARVQLRRRAGTGAAGAGGAAPGRRVRAALPQGGIVTPPDETVRAVEAVLFAATEPLTPDMIRAHVGEGDVPAALARLTQDYAGRGIALVRRGDRWQFETAPDLARLLRRDREEQRKLSRAGIETLAIIAYHEPVSRAEIEAIRGVQISKGTLDVLMEAGWVRPCRPARGSGATADLCDDAGLSHAFRAGEPARPARHRRPARGGAARSGRPGDGADGRGGRGIGGEWDGGVPICRSPAKAGAQEPQALTCMTLGSRLRARTACMSFDRYRYRSAAPHRKNPYDHRRN